MVSLSVRIFHLHLILFSLVSEISLNEQHNHGLLLKNLVILTRALNILLERHSDISCLTQLKGLFDLSIRSQSSFQKRWSHKLKQFPMSNPTSSPSSIDTRSLPPSLWTSIEANLLRCLLHTKPQNRIPHIPIFPEILNLIVPRFFSYLPAQCFLSETLFTGKRSETPELTCPIIRELCHWCLAWSLYSPESILSMISSHPNMLDVLLSLGNLMPFLKATPSDQKEWRLLIQSSLSLLMLHHLRMEKCKCLSARPLFDRIIKETQSLPNPIVLLSKTRRSTHHWIHRLPPPRHDLYVLLRDTVWHIYSETSSRDPMFYYSSTLLPDTDYYYYYHPHQQE
jgi:hypothetical protein